MLKLSRRGWNNVLIFVVLILMFVLYGIPQRLSELKRAPESRLIPESSELLMVAFSHTRLVKVGESWRLQPMINRPVDASQLALAWQYGLLTPIDVDTNASRIPIAQASIQLAGDFSPRIWLLYEDDTQMGVYLLQQAGQHQFYVLNAKQAAQLFLL